MPRNKNPETARKMAEVVALRRQRLTQDEIARRLGISQPRVSQLYTQALAEIPASQVAEHRSEELMLIDDAIADLLDLARDHTRPRTAVEAWNSIRGWADRKAKLIGLDAPTKSRVEVITADMIEAQIAELESQIARNDHEGRA